MKAILEFNLPEDEYEHRNAIYGSNYARLVEELDGVARGWIKYGHEFKAIEQALQKVRDTILEMKQDGGITDDF